MCVLHVTLCVLLSVRVNLCVTVCVSDVSVSFSSPLCIYSERDIVELLCCCPLPLYIVRHIGLLRIYYFESRAD